MTRSTESIARAAYLQLPAADRVLVDSWRHLGNSWFDSVVNSGVLVSTGRRIRPEQAAHAEESERIAEIIAQEQARIGLIGEELSRKEAAHHEAAHAAVAQSFGLEVRVAHIQPSGAGACLYQPAKSSFQTAAISLAGELWIEVFCSRVFLSGPSGCEADRRTAVQALPDQMQRAKAWSYARQVLYENQNPS